MRSHDCLELSDRPLAHFPNSSFNNTGSFFRLRKVRKAIAFLTGIGMASVAIAEAVVALAAYGLKGDKSLVKV